VFPSFGSKRMGALIIQDPTLLHQADLFAGLGRDGYLLANSTSNFGELGLDEVAAPALDDAGTTADHSRPTVPWTG
jgi:hypothetical protein